ncbi:MAG: hypothetical protein Q9181_007983 [Wetmoreana brouardii]
MSAPTLPANEDPQKAREAKITARLSKISKQQNVTQDSKRLQLLTHSAVDEAQQQKTRLHERRLARPCFAKSSVALQEFMSTISQFMKAYSGLNEVAKGVDSQYGGLVTGALSVLVQIGENKEGRESAITDIFDELTKSWIGDAGRLSLYSEAYPTSLRMEDFIADVYLGIAELAVDSAEYYSRPPYVRFWQAIRRPPKLGIDRKADEIKKAIHEVVSEGNALLNRTNAQQNKVLEENRAQQRHDQIAHMARELDISLELADPGRMIAQCKALHANAFEKAVRRKGTKQLQQISLGVLKDLHLYNPSGKPTESSVLVLTGLNYDLYETGRDLCWLSPVTTEIAELYQKGQGSESMSKVLFHSPCRDQASRRSTKKEPFNDCLSRFIIQILRWDDKYFSQNRQSIEDDIKHSKLQRIKTLQTLLEGWHGSDEVCIIIDRLDGIAPLDGDRDSDEDEVSGLLETILEVVSTASCKIRLIVTVDSSGWPQVRKDADLEERWNIWKKRNNLQRFSPLFKVDWQQPEIQDW